jgi:D-threonate/D-erythronate kinase
MVIVLADDFSGAAEIGGIGHRYGLNTEVQLAIDTSSTADLIVVDTDTRALSEEDAVQKISEVTAKLSVMPGIRLFKKIDSVMRGHLIPELNPLQQQLSFKRIFILPANPVHGRKIIHGKYLVNGVPLNETVFAVDPHFPCSTADVTARIRSDRSNFQHTHADPDHIPFAGLITGDIESTGDLENFVAATDERDLCCGGAELFECFLEHLGYRTSVASKDDSDNNFVLIINGSTARSQSDKELFDYLEIPQFFVPGTFSHESFTINDEEVQQSFIHILAALLSRKMAVVSIAHPVHPDKAVSEIFLNYFVELNHYLTVRMQMNDIHFCLTGGATASAVIRNSAVGKIHISAEIAPGVVSLITDRKERFTVKPGSYPWPRPWLKRLLHSGK